MQKFSFSQRLHKQEDFGFALKKKGRFISKWGSLHVSPNVAGFERLGIIVSKRVVNKAVARNRIKRIIREIFRQRCANKTKPLDFVVKLKHRLDEDHEVVFAQTLTKLLLDELAEHK